MKKIFAGMFIALSLLGASAAANAAADITATQALVFKGDTSDVGATIAKTTANEIIKGKTFSESFTFTVSQSFDVSSAVISIALSTKSGLDISSFTLTGGNGVSISGIKTVVGTTQFYNLEAAGLTSGSYTLTALGKVTGTDGGSFGGNISISAVPEASTTAMMLAGLAIVGFGAYRRRRQDVKRVNLGNIAMA